MPHVKAFTGHLILSAILSGRKQPTPSAGGETKAGMCHVLKARPSETALSPSGFLPLPDHIIYYGAVCTVSQTLRERPEGCDHMELDFMGTQDKNI